MNSHTFRIIIEPDEDDTFHGYVPRLPGCHTWGKTIGETRKNLQDAIRVYLESLLDDGEAIPEESGYELLETVTLALLSHPEPVAKLAYLCHSRESGNPVSCI